MHPIKNKSNVSVKTSHNLTFVKVQLYYDMGVVINHNLKGQSDCMEGVVQKSKADGKAKSAPPKDSVFFQAVIFRKEGQKPDTLELNDKVPDFSDIIAASDQDLAYIGKGNGIEFSASASAVEIVMVLTDLFPKMFEYFDSISTVQFADANGNVVEADPWVLTMPERQRLKTKNAFTHFDQPLRIPSTMMALLFQNNTAAAEEYEEGSDDEASDSEAVWAVKKSHWSHSSSLEKWSRNKMSLRSIFNDEVAAEIAAEAVAGPSTAGPSNSIDLTHSRSPTPLFLEQSTPHHKTIPIDPSYSRISDTGPTVPNPYTTRLDFKFF
ncbi:hypothetical protein C8R45DRAFT_931983 [Mycena sanguinolenta]|nr:hypothetical protein C8R45DRAFT_931983 [Mycena sanguinolenta]